MQANASSNLDPAQTLPNTTFSTPTISTTTTSTITTTPTTIVQSSPQPQPLVPPCNSENYSYKRHVCRICPNVRSVYPHVIRRHEEKIHGIVSEKEKKGTVIQSSQPISDIDIDNNNEENSKPVSLPLFNIQLDSDFKLFICGPSRSGKTTLVGQLLSNLSTITRNKPEKIVYIYSKWQK